MGSDEQADVWDLTTASPLLTLYTGTETNVQGTNLQLQLGHDGG